MLTTLSLIALLLALLLLVHFYVKPFIPIPESWVERFNRRGVGYTPLRTFAAQAASGLSSSTFDIESANIREGDSRMGLDEDGVRDVREIMRVEGVGFDQARLIRQNRILAENGIDPSGMPLDSKAVTRL